MGCVSRNLVAINFCDSIARMNASTELSRAIGNEISNNETTVWFGAEHDTHTALATDKAGLLVGADMMVQALPVLITATIGKLWFGNAAWNLQRCQSLKLRGST